MTELALNQNQMSGPLKDFVEGVNKLKADMLDERKKQMQAQYSREHKIPEPPLSASATAKLDGTAAYDTMQLNQTLVDAMLDKIQHPGSRRILLAIMVGLIPAFAIGALAAMYMTRDRGVANPFGNPGGQPEAPNPYVFSLSPEATEDWLNRPLQDRHLPFEPTKTAPNGMPLPDQKTFVTEDEEAVSAGGSSDSVAPIEVAPDMGDDGGEGDGDDGSSEGDKQNGDGGENPNQEATPGSVPTNTKESATATPQAVAENIGIGADGSVSFDFLKSRYPEDVTFDYSTLQKVPKSTEFPGGLKEVKTPTTVKIDYDSWIMDKNGKPLPLGVLSQEEVYSLLPPEILANPQFSMVPTDGEKNFWIHAKYLTNHDFFPGKYVAIPHPTKPNQWFVFDVQSGFSHLGAAVIGADGKAINNDTRMSSGTFLNKGDVTPDANVNGVKYQIAEGGSVLLLINGSESNREWGIQRNQGTAQESLKNATTLDLVFGGVVIPIDNPLKK